MDLNFETLVALTKQGESSTLEFKKSTAQLKSATESLCAFLNTYGGIVLTGVLQNGEIIGQDISDATQQEIANQMQKFEPHASVNISYIGLPNSNKKVIAMQALPHSNEKPYIFDGRPYYREQSSTVIMPQSRYQQQLMHRQNHSTAWDAQITVDYQIKDLDAQRILNVFQEGVRRERLPAHSPNNDTMEILWRLKLLRDNKLTNAAVVLFCRDPMPLYTQCLVKLACFSDETKREVIDSQQIYANLFELYERTQDFISRHTRVASHFTPDNFSRIDIPDYPVLAVREALINAFCHRDYAIMGSSTFIAIYPNSIEISSHGCLPNGLTPELLKTRHESQPRNTLIANVLYRCGLIETYGTGTQEIMRICHEENRPHPEFIERGNVMVVKMHKPFTESSTLKRDTKQSLSERQKNIIGLLQEIPYLTNQQIMSTLSIAERTLRRELITLREFDLIDSIGEKRAKQWFLK